MRGAAYYIIPIYAATANIGRMYRESLTPRQEPAFLERRDGRHLMAYQPKVAAVARQRPPQQTCRTPQLGDLVISDAEVEPAISSSRPFHFRRLHYRAFIGLCAVPPSCTSRRGREFRFKLL